MFKAGTALACERSSAMPYRRAIRARQHLWAALVKESPRPAWSALRRKRFRRLTTG
jgi:hypothetical protein